MKEIKSPKKVNMKKLFRRNQIIITTLAIMIAAAGYLNYAGKKEMAANSDVFEAGAMEISDEDILAENQALSGADTGGLMEIPSLDQDLEDVERLAAAESQSGAAESQGEDGAQDKTDMASAQTESQAAPGTDGGAAAEQTGLENPGEAVLTSGMNVSDYIANVQLSREQVRAKNKETLMNIINNTNVEEAAKKEAIQEMIDMTAISEKENAAETLLMAKGFSNPVVSITNGKVDVVINASSITDPQRAQIEDIVKRKTEVGADGIIITLLNLAE